MAKMTVKGLDEISAKLEVLGTKGTNMAKACVYEGAKVIADNVKSNIGSLPVDSWRPKNTTTNGPYNVLTATNKADLESGFGISSIEVTGGGAEAVIGFAGMGSAPSKKYPGGLPNALLARAIESGSSARSAHPFVRPAVNRSKAAAAAAMQAKADEFIGNIMK